MTDAEFQELKRQWRASPLASFLSRHAMCASTAIDGDAAVMAWLEADGLRCWCRHCGDTLEVSDDGLPVASADKFWSVLCVGVVTAHPRLFSEDMTGATLAQHVNRLSQVLRRAALLAAAGGDGAAVH